MQGESKKFVRRKHYLIDKQFQHNVVGRFVGVVVASILVSHLVTIGVMRVREMLKGAEDELMYFTNPVNQTLAFTRILDILWMPMLISCLLGCLAVIFFGVFFSHRIAGPMFNLKRMMHQVGEGDLNVVMHIRMKDEFHDVEMAFNEMLQALRGRLEELGDMAKDFPSEQRQKVEAFLADLKLGRK